MMTESELQNPLLKASHSDRLLKHLLVRTKRDNHQSSMAASKIYLATSRTVRDSISMEVNNISEVEVELWPLNSHASYILIGTHKCTHAYIKQTNKPRIIILQYLRVML